jgi:cytochrome b pre-mRNA-processing protein 3
VLRELGVGDLSIPKKVRRLAASSAALLQSYEENFSKGVGALASTIAQALPLDGEDAEAVGERLAHYVKDVLRHLEREPLSVLKSGVLKFMEIDPVKG